VTRELFEDWADYRAGEFIAAPLVRRMGLVCRKVKRLLRGGVQRGELDLVTRVVTKQTLV